MARVECAPQSWGVIQDRNGNVLANFPFTITTTVYAGATGGTTVSSLVTTANGEIPGWVDAPGQYTLTVNNPQTGAAVVSHTVEAVPAAGTPGATGPAGTASWAEYTLASGTSVGATSVTVDRAATLAPGNGYVVAIDPFTTDCEVRKVTVSGTTLSFTPALAYAHASGDRVLFVEGDSLSVALFNAKGDGTTDDTTAIQRALDQVNPSTVAGTFSTVFFPEGVYGITSPLRPIRETTLQGNGVQACTISALAGFSFPNNDTAILCGPETPVFATPGPSRRMFIRDLTLNGNSITGSNGILISPQQPAFMENVRIDDCKGYGLAIVDCQQFISRNVEIINCGTGLRLNSASFCWFFGLDIEQSDVHHIHMTQQTGGTGNKGNAFYGLHMETLDNGSVENILVENSGDVLFDTVWCTPQANQTIFKFDSAGPVPYRIRGVTLTGGDSTITMIRDVNRGLTTPAYTGFRDGIVAMDGGPSASGVDIPAWWVQGMSGRGLRMSTAPSAAIVDAYGGTNSTGAFRARNSADAIVWEVFPDGYVEMTEQTDPAAPAANKARLYTRDNGAGKSQLVVRFPTGAIQILATEP